MKKEKKIIYCGWFPPKGYSAITLFGYIVARKQYKPLSSSTVNHERIHVAQAADCGGYVRFYWLYLFRYWLPVWLRSGFDNAKAYRNIPFEREAFGNQWDLSYLEYREKGAWKNYEL
jgi:hypothetical protein